MPVESQQGRCAELGHPGSRCLRLRRGLEEQVGPGKGLRWFEDGLIMIREMREAGLSNVDIMLEIAGAIAVFAVPIGLMFLGELR